MKKKYELTNESKVVSGKTVYRIRALYNFGRVSAGELGGFVESEENLSHKGNAWVTQEAIVFENARVEDNAEIFGEAKIYENACVGGNALIHDQACICGNAHIFGNTDIWNKAEIFDNAKISGYTRVWEDAKVFGNAEISGYARICGEARIFGEANIEDNILIAGDSEISWDIMIGKKKKDFLPPNYTVYNSVYDLFQPIFNWLQCHYPAGEVKFIVDKNSAEMIQKYGVMVLDKSLMKPIVNRFCIPPQKEEEKE